MGDNDTEDVGENDTEDIDLTVALRPTRPLRLSSTGPIEDTYTDFAQMTAAMTKAMNNMQTMVRAAEQILRAHGSSRNTTEKRVLVPKTLATSGINDATRGSDSAVVPETLFGVPVELATLDNDDSEIDDCDSESDEDNDTARSSTRKRKQRYAPRQWTAEDQRQLRRMKKKGWTDAQIGRALDRSAGAISQQWRKQRKIDAFR